MILLRAKNYLAKVMLCVVRPLFTVTMYIPDARLFKSIIEDVPAVIDIREKDRTIVPFGEIS